MKILVPLLLAAGIGCSSRSVLTESQEYFVGRGVAANAIADAAEESVRSGGSPVGLLGSTELEDYVSLVGLTLALESDRPETFKGYHFGVLNSEQINAFSAPGGFIFVTTGAIKHMQNEDELAAVLAHEVAHVNLRHPEIAANRAADRAGFYEVASFLGGIAAGVLFKDDPGVAEKVSQVFDKLMDGLSKEIVKGYGRDEELAADAVAVDLLTRPGVGYDPNALRAFITRLPQGEAGAWSSAVESSTHPGKENRLKIVDEEMKKRGVKPSLDADRTKRFNALTVGIRGQ